MRDTPSTSSPSGVDLLRQAALWGPGHRGRRETATPEDRRKLAGQLAEAGLSPPPYLAQERAWVDRRAKLFEVGEYPDKGVTVSESHLQALCESFDLPVPVLIEHARSPFELGYLTELEAQAGELFGTVALTPEAHELIESSNARSLSLGLTPALTEIREVSLVERPRIATARLFADGPEFTAEWGAEWRDERAEFLAQRGEDWLQGLLAEGRIVPAQLEPARVLLGALASQFAADGKVPAAFRELLGRAAPHRLFGQVAPSPSSPSPQLGAEEAEFYRRYFPGVSLDQIALRKPEPHAG
jgi:hypothetical protein